MTTVESTSVIVHFAVPTENSVLRVVTAGPYIEPGLELDQLVASPKGDLTLYIRVVNDRGGRRSTCSSMSLRSSTGSKSE